MEGFSGIDGRTTIFDYWGVRTLQAWANHGLYDGAGLTERERQLRDFYQRLLTVARDDKAIGKGELYDIAYAQGEGFDRRNHFAFLRHTGNETLLVVVNFHDREQAIEVKLPNDAFVYLGLTEIEHALGTDLLRGGTFPLRFVPDAVNTVTLQAWTGVILRLAKSR